MIHYITGNLLESPAAALVNTVNTFGVMGKGIALQFKHQFPQNYKKYVKAFKNNELQIGKLLITQESDKFIINFPTKTDWRKPSEYEYVELGLKALVTWIQTQAIPSIAVPPLGAGNGKLDWMKVRTLIEHYLNPLTCEVFLYQPSVPFQSIARPERALLTPARAMLLAVLYDLVGYGEFVSEFAAEKVCYFLQRFGAKSLFQLEFQPYFYGPYSGKVRHVLYALNGTYLNGCASKDQKPFEPLDLVMTAEKDILHYLADKPNEAMMVEQTKHFLRGFYSNFCLELLSTLDFIRETQQTTERTLIRQQLNQWSERKSQLGSNESFFNQMMERLEQTFSQKNEC
jgi:O-acetyl-ADP-ribose deacetylase (regulator of RNase III)